MSSSPTRRSPAEYGRLAIFGMIGAACGYWLMSVSFKNGISGVTNRESSLGASGTQTLTAIEKVTDEPSRRNKITDYIQGLKSDDYPAALELMLGTLIGDDRQFAIAALLKKWSEFSPATAVERAFALRVTVVPPKLWKDLLSAWAKKSEKEALAWAAKQPEGSRRREAIIVVAEGVLESDPARAVRLLSEAGLRAEDASILKKALKLWAAQSFEEAAAYTKAMKDIGMQQVMVEALLEAREGFPVLESLKWLGSLPTGVFQQEAVSKLLRSWMNADNSTALKYATDDLPLSKKRAELLSYGIGLLARDRLADAIAFYNTLAEPDRALVLEALVAAGMSANRQDTLAFIQGIPEESLRLKALGQAIGTLSKWSITEAMELLKTFPQGTARAAAVGKLTTVLAETDLRAAADFCLKEAPLILDTRWHKQLGPLILTWGKKDVHAAVEWIRSLPKGLIRTWLLRAAIAGDKMSPQERLALARSFDPETYEKIQEDVVPNWTHNKEGKEWLAKMPEGQTRDKIIEMMANSVDHEEAATFEKWLSKLSPREFDVAASQAAIVIAHNKKDSVRALELSAKITEARRRFQAADTAYGVWVRRDPQTAAHWLNSTPLFPEPYKEKLRQGYATYAHEDQ